ncbi:MAG: flavodoxin-dependent (E)-4-hydroxy-3-methylbut-2-enyl-diphosphate synthase [Clostridia bacterium]
MNKDIRKVKIADLTFGDGNILIQSMTNTKTIDIEATLNQTRQLFTAGADIVRISIPDMNSVKALSNIKHEINRPLVADIHFDYRLAIESLLAGADKVRINPGNIGSWENVIKIFAMAKKLDKCVRVGVNSGSLEKDILEKYKHPTAKALAESALKYDRKLLESGFENFVVSIKSSDVITTIRSNKMFREKSNTPLHVGVTEAGTFVRGTIKSSIGIGSLLLDGIGETIRVSLTADPVREIEVAKLILKSIGLRKEGIEIISCPTCARTNGDLIDIVTKVEEVVGQKQDNLKIAIMGCVVNGPGEAREADIGLALGKVKGVLFKKGEVVTTVHANDYLDVILKEIDKMTTANN